MKILGFSMSNVPIPTVIWAIRLRLAPQADPLDLLFHPREDFPEPLIEPVFELALQLVRKNKLLCGNKDSLSTAFLKIMWQCIIERVGTAPVTPGHESMRAEPQVELSPFLVARVVYAKAKQGVENLERRTLANDYLGKATSTPSVHPLSGLLYPI